MTRDEVLRGLEQITNDQFMNARADYWVLVCAGASALLNPTPVKPIKTYETLSTVGVDGVLIIGECPECHQRWLNNRDNKFCGGCGAPIDWSKS